MEKLFPNLFAENLFSISFLLSLSPFSYSFSTGGGIYGKCDTEGTGACREFWEFRFASGLCVTEEDGGAPDDDCWLNAND